MIVGKPVQDLLNIMTMVMWTANKVHDFMTKRVVITIKKITSVKQIFTAHEKCSRVRETWFKCIKITKISLIFFYSVHDAGKNIHDIVNQIHWNHEQNSNLTHSGFIDAIMSLVHDFHESDSRFRECSSRHHERY